MMVLIEYKGFRIVAQSILPINENTLIYGSADGGATLAYILSLV